MMGVEGGWRPLIPPQALSTPQAWNTGGLDLKGKRELEDVFKQILEHNFNIKQNKMHKNIR